MNDSQYPTTPITPSQTKIGWIGTGVMGSAMASRLLSAGYHLTIYARTPSKTLSLQSQGAHLVTSPSQVAKQCHIIFTMLGHPPDVRQIVSESPDSILSSVNAGTVIVDHTSSHPALAKELFDAAREKKCWCVDAPVSGGDIGAREGKLAIFAGGDERVVKWLMPLFDVMGRATYVGGAGCGQSCKIGNQITVGGSLLGLSEGLVFAESVGLDKALWMQAVRGGAAGSMVMELFGERMIGRDFRPGGFAEYMVKDLGMGLDVVEEEDGGGEVAVLPGAGLCKQLFSGMVANGDGKLGTQGLITVIERINGKSSWDFNQSYINMVRSILQCLVSKRVTNTSESSHTVKPGFHINTVVLAALLCTLVAGLALNSIIKYALRWRRAFLDAASSMNADRQNNTVHVSQMEVFGLGADVLVTECSICLGDFVDGEKVRVLPVCNHQFHVKCIDMWLVEQTSCPNCRHLVALTPV